MNVIINKTGLALILIISAFGFSGEKNMSIYYLKNEKLKTIKQHWPGNPVNGGEFHNLGKPVNTSFTKVIQWKFSKNPQREEKKNDKWLPKISPIDINKLTEEKGDFIIWLGHASFLLRINGKTILTDPVFYDVSIIKRKIGNAIAPEEFKNIDYVLISHGHMDHCDKKSLKTLAKNNNFKVLLPLKLDELVKEWLPKHEVQSAGWYQQFDLEKDTALQIFMMPAKHWYKRTLFDTNKRLWGSFVIKTQKQTIYFSGDTGYDEHFREITDFFPEIDICLMSVGAYKPRFMMHESHMNPEEAVLGFNQMHGKTFIPCHYGTYDLSDEPISEPVKLLREMKNEGKLNGKLVIPDVGEIVNF